MAEERTQNINLTKIPVWVVETFQREADRNRRDRLEEFRIALERRANQIIAREQRAAGGDTSAVGGEE
jgi:hypothetical protein